MEDTIESKLGALLELQTIDCELDEIAKIRGVLPEEVASLKDGLIDLQERSQNIQEEIANIKQEISTQRVNIKTIETALKKYEEQQMDVRNNREYDAITKEVDLQKLEIQIAEKKIKNAYERIETQKLALEECKASAETQNQILSSKKAALKVLIGESEEDEQRLHEQRKKVMQLVEVKLLKAYERIRENVRNKLAVVVVKREACGGCFNQVPPQKQADIKEKKRIILCEHCGRIIADVLVVLEEDV